MKTPKLNTSYAAMGFYTCIDENTYDGAEDSSKFSRMIGTGKTPQLAELDYWEQLREYHEENGEECYYHEFLEAEKLADKIDSATDQTREQGL